MLWWPGRVPAGAVVPQPVSNRDVPATILALLGLGSEVHFPGRSLTRFWTAGADTTPDLIFAEVRHAPRLPAWYPSTRGDMIGVLADGLHYIRNGDGIPELYDINTDPEERTNLATDTLRLPVTRRLRSIVDSARPMRR